MFSNIEENKEVEKIEVIILWLFYMFLLSICTYMSFPILQCVK